VIITRSPLRITLGGGGTDLPSYYRDHSGFLIAAAIDKYVYITLHTTFVQEVIVKYSKLERVKSIDQIEHPLVREALKLCQIENPWLEITSMADIPAGTGLGSSGSFTVALLKALHIYKRNLVSPTQIAEQACEIEMNRLKEPVGKQDQYITSLGGITCFHYHRDGRVISQPLEISEATRYGLEENLLLFFTGFSRSASAILKDQDQRTLANDPGIIKNLNEVKEIAFETQRALCAGNLHGFAQLLNQQWEKKMKRSPGASIDQIAEWYEFGLAHGALGGKLIGAGGGGFLMFYSEDKSRLRAAMAQKGLREIRFQFDFEGTKGIAQ